MSIPLVAIRPGAIVVCIRHHVAECVARFFSLFLFSKPRSSLQGNKPIGRSNRYEKFANSSSISSVLDLRYADEPYDIYCGTLKAGTYVL